MRSYHEFEVKYILFVKTEFILFESKSSFRERVLVGSNKAHLNMWKCGLGFGLTLRKWLILFNLMILLPIYPSRDHSVSFHHFFVYNKIWAPYLPLVTIQQFTVIKAFLSGCFLSTMRYISCMIRCTDALETHVVTSFDERTEISVRTSGPFIQSNCILLPSFL